MTLGWFYLNAGARIALEATRFLMIFEVPPAILTLQLNR